MISPKKQKIYIGIIVFCLTGIVVVFSLNGRSNTQIPFPADPNNPEQRVPPFDSSPSAAVAIPNSAGFESSNTEQSGTFPRPSVFPTDGSFDLSIFESSTFKALTPIGEITLDDDELGKENPFK